MTGESEESLAKYLFDKERELAEIPLSKASRLRVSLVPTQAGTTSVGVREWVDERGYSGPTKKGLILDEVGHVEAVIEALSRAQRSMRDSEAAAR